MKKRLLASAIAHIISMQETHAYSMTDLKIDNAPQPATRRGKFKRRTRSNKK